jgi:hypothetical protein
MEFWNHGAHAESRGARFAEEQFMKRMVAAQSL